MRRAPRYVVGVATATAGILGLALLFSAGPFAATAPSTGDAILSGPASAQPPAATPGATVAPDTATPSASPVVDLHLDGLATVVARRGAQLLQRPDGRVLNDPASTVAAGTTVFLADRRVDGEGRSWWAISAGGGAPYGWVADTDPSGRPVLAPIALECPTGENLGGPTYRGIGTLGALACFGDRELTFSGLVTCTPAAIDYAVGGASWLDDNVSCALDDILPLNGPPVAALLEDQVRPANIVRGTFIVHGHFDDAEARLCFPVTFGVFVSSPTATPEPSAVLSCRTQIVVTAIEPA